jgi:hypothetical protein
MYIFDEDSANDVAVEDRPVRKFESDMLKAIETALHDVYANSNIATNVKLALTGLTSEELSEIENNVY